MATQKMVYVSSNDYWGYAKADFNTALNFYEYTWVVPQTMYDGMDEENRAQLYPCALFYVQGVTDNHNFLTLSVNVDSDDAKVIGSDPKIINKFFDFEEDKDPEKLKFYQSDFFASPDLPISFKKLLYTTSQ